MRNETTHPVTHPGTTPDAHLGALPGRPPSGTGRGGTAAVLKLFLGRLFSDRQV